MAAYLVLVRKSDSKRFEGADLAQLDDDMARHFGEKPDDTKWFRNWMNCIALTLAATNSFDISWRDKLSKELIEVLKYLEENYTLESYYGR